LGPPKSCIANLFVVFRFSPFLLGCTRHTNPSECKSFFCDSVTNAHRAKANQHGRPMWFGYDGARRGLGRKRIGKQSEACNPDVGFLSCDLRPLVRCFLCWRNANLAGTFACRRCVAWFLFFFLLHGSASLYEAETFHTFCNFFNRFSHCQRTEP
jgi:hypothetical protein